MTPVDPPIVNFNKKISPNNAEEDLISKRRGLPKYVHNQLKIFVPVGNEIKIVTAVK